MSEDKAELTSPQNKDKQKIPWLTPLFIHQAASQEKKKKVQYTSQLSLNYWEPFILTH